MRLIAHYGDLSSHEEAIRRYIKTHFADLKEKQIKDLLDRSTWTNAKATMLKAKALQAQIATAQSDDMNGYEDVVSKAAKAREYQPRRQRQKSD
jgi:type I restriction enzyme M protein